MNRPLMDTDSVGSSGATRLRHVIIMTGRYPGKGGVEISVSYLRDAFRAAKIDARVVTIFGKLDDSGDTAEIVIFDRRPELQEGSVTGGKPTFRALARAPRFIIKRIDRNRGLRKLAAQIPADDGCTLVIATSPRVASYLADSGALARRGRPKVVVQYHIPFEAQVSLEGVGLPVSSGLNVDATVALSKSDAARYERQLGIPSYSIPNPAPTSSGTTVAEADPDSRKYRVVALCRLSAEKQLDKMIDIFCSAIADPEFIEWQLDIYGEGPQKVVLEKKIGALHELSDRIHLRGWVASPAAVLQDAAVILSTSRFEAFGMSILEAARCGVPAIAFACSEGVTDLVNALGGILLPPDDDAGFVNQLRALLADSARRLRLSEAAREGSLRYDPSVVASEWMDLASELWKAGPDTTVVPGR